MVTERLYSPCIVNVEFVMETTDRVSVSDLLEMLSWSVWADGDLSTSDVHFTIPLNFTKRTHTD